MVVAVILVADLVVAQVVLVAQALLAVVSIISLAQSQQYRDALVMFKWLKQVL